MDVKQNDDECLRKLASVQLIDEIKYHSNADSLELAIIGGWQVVIRKDDGFKAGDKIIYFEIDSLLPKEKEWAKPFEKNKFRIKTIKLRKELSQGLILPLSILGKDVDFSKFEVGKDLTKDLDVTKYENDSEEPYNGGKNKVSGFPSHFGIEKTDEPRIQSNVKYLEIFKGQPYYASLKYDGTSSTFFVDPMKKNEFYICSRNQRVTSDDTDLTCVYSQAATKFNLKEKLTSLGCKYAIQGEIYGPKIQNNLLKKKDLCLSVFSIFDFDTQKFVDMQELIDICQKLDLQMVEIIEKGDSFNYNMHQLKEKSKGLYEGTTNFREGLVFRLQKNWHDHDKSSRCSFKIINDDFLLDKK